MGNFNERQAEIIKLFADEPTAMVTIKDLEVKFGVSPTTAKSDIIGLLGENIVSEISLNKVKRAYIKGDGLDELLSKAQEASLSILSNFANIGKNWNTWRLYSTFVRCLFRSESVFHEPWLGLQRLKPFVR